MSENSRNHENPRTREEHLEWCKTRALGYLNIGDLSEAVVSMLSDLDKHTETKLAKDSPLSMLGILYAATHDLPGVRRFIEGFR